MEVGVTFEIFKGEETKKEVGTIAEAMAFVMSQKGGENDHWMIISETILLSGYYDKEGRPNVWTAKDIEI